MTKALDLEAIKAKAKPKTIKIDLPEKVGFVYGRQWSLRESDEIQALAKKLAVTEGAENEEYELQWRELVVKYGICNEAGVPLFDDTTIEEMYNLPLEVVGCMVTGAVKANGFDLTAAQEEDSPN